MTVAACVVCGYPAFRYGPDGHAAWCATVRPLITAPDPPPPPPPPRILHPCGTLGAFWRHRRRGEIPCPSCVAARRAYDRKRKVIA